MEESNGIAVRAAAGRDVVREGLRLGSQMN